MPTKQSIGATYEHGMQTKAMPTPTESVAFSARLREAMTAAGSPPETRGIKAALARRHGVAPATVNGWINGAYMPEPDKVRVMAHDYGVSYDWLYFGKGTKTSGGLYTDRIQVPAFEVRGVEDNDGLDPTREIMLPVYDVEVSGGDGTPIPDFIETRYRLPYQMWWLNSVGAKASDILIMKVRGNSMEGLMWAGDKAVVHRGRTRVRDDCVYALLYAGEARVKRLFNTPDGGLRIVSQSEDKARYPDEYVQKKDMHRVLILGQVIDKMGSGGLGVV